MPARKVKIDSDNNNMNVSEEKTQYKNKLLECKKDILKSFYKECWDQSKSLSSSTCFDTEYQAGRFSMKLDKEFSKIIVCYESDFRIVKYDFVDKIMLSDQHKKMINNNPPHVEFDTKTLTNAIEKLVSSALHKWKISVINDNPDTTLDIDDVIRETSKNIIILECLETLIDTLQHKNEYQSIQSMSSVKNLADFIGIEIDILPRQMNPQFAHLDPRMISGNLGALPKTKLKCVGCDNNTLIMAEA